MTDIFPEIKTIFEDRLAAIAVIELLEYHYYRYAFGSGLVAYGIKGMNIKLIFDGRDRVIEILKTPIHVKYDTSNWMNVFEGSIDEFKSLDLENIIKHE